MIGPRFSWSQPCCDDCWTRRDGERTPFRMNFPVKEICAWCGMFTESGIYVRHDPADVPFPRVDE